jgi:voltage-gated potassium channel Kch
MNYTNSNVHLLHEPANQARSASVAVPQAPRVVDVEPVRFGILPRQRDLGLNTVRELREQGMRGIYGDATHRDTLVQAGAAHADNLILTSAGMGDAREVIRNAKELNPTIATSINVGFRQRLRTSS